MRVFLLFIVLFIAVSAYAQRRLPLNDPQQLQQRLKALHLTAEQKRRIIILIRRQRLQNSMNRKELNEILTEEQKKKLKEWKEEKREVARDSTVQHK